MKIKAIAIAGITSALVSVALAAEPEGKPASPEATAITSQVADYVKAYNEGDAKGLAQYFAADAAYTDENGQLTDGRSHIQQLLTDTFSATQPPTPSIKFPSV